MPRKCKIRKIGFIPKSKSFKPEDIEITDAVNIQFDELEAMRLKDIEELNQEECAKLMGVSRQTFQLIIDSAHKLVAKALIESRPIQISGGSFILSADCNGCENFDSIKNICNCPKYCTIKTKVQQDC